MGRRVKHAPLVVAPMRAPLVALLLLSFAAPLAAASDDVPDCEARRGGILRPPEQWVRASCEHDGETLFDLTAGNLECVRGEILGQPIECPV